MTELARYPRVSSLKTVTEFRAHVASLGLDLSCDDAVLAAPASPLAEPLSIGGRRVGNRFAIHPMEGWDGTTDGMPTEATLRRWANFGRSGAKLIWGGEAFAVCPEGRANPNQLMAAGSTRAGMAALRQALLAAHAERWGTTDDLLLGLQLTHSGRFCRPFRKDRMEPVILYRHPVLDRRFGVAPDHPVLEDGQVERIVDLYVQAARVAQQVGFDFVDVKHCHGYLGHEFLSAHTRPGRFGGSLENRTRFCRQIVEGMGAEARGLLVGVRLSAFDTVPYRPDPDRTEGRRLGPGIPEPHADLLPYAWGFGLSPDDPLAIDLSEPLRFVEMLGALGVKLLNVSAGSPYYNPHLQRPALFPPSDGYQPPEDPLVGVARQIGVTARIKERFPDRVVVGTGYTYLQEYLPHVAQWQTRQGRVDAVGLGRMALAYPELPGDVLERGRLERRRLCRTFSDCTTAPRRGLISGCYPLDPYYRDREEGEVLRRLKSG